MGTVKGVMRMFRESVPLWPVFVASVAYMALGFVWYSETLFGKPWMRLVGMTKKKMGKHKGEMPKVFATSFGASLVTAYVLAGLLGFVGITTLMGALKLGFWVGLGMVFMTQIHDYLYTYKPLQLWVISSGYQFAGVMLMAVVLSYWL